MLFDAMRERDEARRDAHRLAMQRDAAFADLANARRRCEELQGAVDEALNALDANMPLVAATTLLGVLGR